MKEKVCTEGIVADGASDTRHLEARVGAILRSLSKEAQGCREVDNGRQTYRSCSLYQYMVKGVISL